MKIVSYEEVLQAEQEARRIRNQEMLRLCGLLWEKVTGLFRHHNDGLGQPSA